jgi:predicted anti-sigma-YlaC factor YlaD
MNRYDCDATRDLLPLLLRQELLPHEAAAVDQHVTGCVGCSAEQALLRLLAQARPAVPPGLEKRVLLAVRRPAPQRWAPARLAMAATLAAAVIGGALVLQRTGYDMTPDALPGAVAFDDASHELSWTMSDDPLLHGSSTLQQLTLEELELVLAELDS